MPEKINEKYEAEKDIPEALRPYYEQTDDGFVFAGLDDVEQKNKVKEFRTTNISLRKENETLKSEFDQFKNKFKGINPEDYKKAMSALERVHDDEEKVLINEGKIDEVVAKRTQTAVDHMNQQLTAKDKAILDREEANKRLQSRLGTLLIDQDLQISVGKTGAKIKDGALEDLLRRGQSIWKIDEEGQRKAFDPRSGEPLYGKTGDHLTMDEFAEKLISEAQYFFEGGAGGGAEPGTRTTVNRDKFVDPRDSHAYSRSLEDIASGKKKVARD